MYRATSCSTTRTLSVTLSICVSVSSSHVCISIFVSGTCFLLSGTEGIGVRGCCSAGGIGTEAFGCASFGAGTVGAPDADAGSGDGALDRATCSFARRFARI